MISINLLKLDFFIILPFFTHYNLILDRVNINKITIQGLTDSIYHLPFDSFSVSLSWNDLGTICPLVK